MAAPAVPATSALETPALRLRRLGSDVSWLAAAKFGLLAGNALTFLLLARWIGTEHFGILATVAGAQILVGRLVLFGTEQTMMRLRSTPGLLHRQEEVEGSALAVLLVAAACVTALGLSAGSIIESLWDRHFAQEQIVMALAGGIGSALVDFAYWAWLARRHYRAAALTHAGLAIGRFLVLYIGLSTAILPSDRVVFTYSSVTFAAGLIQLGILTGVLQFRPTLALAPRLLRYSAWQAGSVILGSLAIYQGTFLLTLLGRKADSGVYGFAVTATVGYMAVYAAASEFLMSRVGNVVTGAALRRFLGRSLAIAAAVIVICIPATYLLAHVIGWVVPANLWDGGTVFYYLVAAALLTVLHAPIEVAAHWLLRPDWIMANKAIRIAAILFTGLQFAHAGDEGVARAQVIGVLAGLVPFAAVVLHRVLRYGATEGPPRRLDEAIGPRL